MFTGIEWEQQRQITDIPVNVQVLDQVTAALGLGSISALLADPEKPYDKELITVLQAISPILPTADAKGILSDLRNTGQAKIPTATLRVNKPIWTALRPGVDVIIPSETSELQRARWVAVRELVSESELEDRIVTDQYDADFVTEAVKHKGVFAGFTPRQSPETDTSMGSNRDMIELYRFYCRYLDNGVPCMYRTVFCDAVKVTPGGEQLYALHRKFEYEHGQYPLVAHRRTFHFKPLLSSIGIADESYTDERDIKIQQDGLNNHADVVLKPPMILPTLRAKQVSNGYSPNAVMTALRPQDVAWAPIPPMDQVPLLVMQQVMERLNRRYPLSGAAVDPEIKTMYRQKQADQCLAETELVLEQTFQLMQQYETADTVQRVAGQSNTPWQFSQQDIQGEYEISATINIKMIDIEQAELQLKMLGEIMPFKDAGGLVFRAAAEIVSPELADAIAQDQMSPQAMQREQADEYNAMTQIRAGIEPTQPQMANNQLRLQVINNILTKQPQLAAQIMNDPVQKVLLQNRIKFFTNQIQQYQVNPQIGRTLAPSALNPSQPATVTQGTPA
jgi:hypothetical protein